MDLIARGMALMGTAQPGRTARVELTGLGAGTFDIALAPDQAPGPPDVTITVSAVELCRLAANRISATELPVDVEGDRSLLEPVLAGAGAFALD
jgi:predicted naringenin-chalcone synthase